jgi:hypothetical protein
MLVYDGVNETKLFADLLSSLRATGKFTSPPAAAVALRSDVATGSSRSEVESAQDALRVAAAETRAAAAEARLAESVLQNTKLVEQLAELKLEIAKLKAGRS